MDIHRQAAVYVREKYAGLLQETDEGYIFTYDREYLGGEKPAAVSLTMPLQKERYFSKTLFPFFDGLIPEGWLLDIVSRNWKIDTKDRFGILMVSCKDAIGNVTVREVE